LAGFIGRTRAVVARLRLATKLAALSVTVVMMPGLVAMVAGGYFIGEGIVRQAQLKVQHDLNSARYIYENAVDNVRTIVGITADRHLLRDAVVARNLSWARGELERIRKREGLDILTVTDVAGRVLARGWNRGEAAVRGCRNPIMSVALARRAPVAGTVIVPREELLREDKDLAEQAHIAFVPTARARLTTETESTSGMMIEAAYPMTDGAGRLIGIVYGGILLNRNYEIVDKVKETVYRSMRYKGRDVGTTTIFEKDLRISTNVRSVDGSRAIGTRLSRDVYERVLIEGKQWVGPAFVVNDWYLTAYEPIRDVTGIIAGILYVGILEKEYDDIRTRTVLFFLGLTLAGMMVALAVSYFVARGITRPMGRLAEAARQFAMGDLAQNVATSSEDELGEVEKAFNMMAHSIKERDEHLKQRAQQIVMKSERLAMIGQLAAGVAHEINNPLGGILIYSSLLLEEGSLPDSAKDCARKIVAQTTRCKNIVKGLLDFARQSKPEKKPTDIGRLLETTLALVEGQAIFQNIEIIRHLEPGMPFVEVDRSQIQQVFMNLIMNAAEAIEGKGRLTVRTGVAGGGKAIEVEFADTGCGISTGNMTRLFEPFFTTKEVGHGTGLGLAISEGIVDKHGGDIRVESEEGKGASFTVVLPTGAGT